MYDTIIIGGGPCGCTAAMYCARAGLSALLLEGSAFGGQMAETEKVHNYPGFDEPIDGYKLAEKMKNSAAKFGAEVKNEKAMSLDLRPKIKTVTTACGKYKAKVVIIATGAGPRRLGLYGENELIGRGISYCAVCDGRFFAEKTVAVAGGGDSAASDTLTLSRLCKKVYLIHRRDSLRASKSYQEALGQTENVELVLNSRVAELLYSDVLRGVVVAKNGGERLKLDCQGLFVAIGRTPESSIASGQLKLDEGGYIEADENCGTSLPGVFAAGDVRRKALRQIITAAADGAVAAHGAEKYIDGGGL